MIKMKRVIGSVLIGCMLLTGMPVSTMPYLTQVSLAREVSQKESKGFCYQVQKDGTVKITGTKLKDGMIIIPEKIAGKKVTTIGKEAFRNNQTVKRIELPASVVEIQDEAFENCNNLEVVIFPEALETVGKYAFSMCDSLYEITLGTNLKQIKEGAFFLCSDLESATMKGNPTLEEYAFAACENLKYAWFFNELTQLPEGIFNNCYALQAVYGMEQVTKVGSYAFSKCQFLQGTFPNLEEVGEHAFSYCNQLSQITIQSEQIASSAFEGCQIQSLELGKEVAGLPADAFLDCTISKVVLGPKVDRNISKAIGKNTVDDFDVDRDNQNLNEVSDSLYSEDEKTLVKQAAKTVRHNEDGNVVIGDQVENIGAYAFSQINAGDELLVSDSVITIEPNAFYDSKFKKISLGLGVKKLEEGTFERSCLLETVQLGKNVETIGDDCFAYCGSLQKLDGMEQVKSIGRRAFFECQGLSELSLSDSLETLGEGVFGRCTLQELKVSGEQPNFKFENKALTSKDGKVLYYYAVSDEAITVPSGVETILSCSVDCTNQGGNIILPDGVKELKKEAIFNHAGQVVIMPDSIETIGESSIGYYGVDNYVNVNQMEMSPAQQILLISKEMNASVKEYAKQNNICCLKERTDFAKDNISLKGGKTFQLELKGINPKELVYCSTDPSIASVSKKGVVKGHKKGTTYITATYGTLTWYVKVRVTSNGKAYKSSYSKYHLEDYVQPEDNYAKWEKGYLKENAKESYVKSENPNIFLYSKNSAYPAMKALLRDGGYYISIAESMYGTNYKRFAQISKNLTYELSKYRLHENTLLYSGIHTISSFTGKTNSTKDLVDSIGKTGVYDCITSATTDLGVASGFANGKSESAILEIYLPKGYNRGAFIQKFSNYGGEKEYLLDSGIKYKIVDAGVRMVEESMEEETYLYSQRYIKIVVDCK